MMPAPQPMDFVRCATAGVGIGPTRKTSMPLETSPLVSAVSSM